MADKRIKGIVIEISGNTTKLQDALKGVEKNTRDITGELSQVEKLLKLSPKSTELLAQKQKLLAEAVANTKDKLGTLKTAQEQAVKALAEGKIGEDQYREITREVMWAERELKNLEQRLSDVNNKWKSAAKDIGAFGDKATALGNKLMPVSAAAGAAVGGIVALAVNSGAAADDLNTLSKQTGITTEDLQKFKYAADIIDVPLEAFTGSMAKLTRNMAGAKDGTGPAADAFKTLGVSVKDANGNLRDNEDVFYDTIDALGKVKSETDRDAMSMSIFGKSAQDLNPLILGGADALKTLGQEAKDAGLIMSQDALDGLNAFNDEIDKTKAQVGAAGMKMSATFGEILLPLLKSLAEWLQTVAQWFSNLSPNVAKTILVVLGIIAAIGPLLLLIGGMASGIAALMPIIAGLGTAFAILTGPIGLVIAIIAAVIAIGVLLYKNWDKIIAFAGNLKNTLVARFNEIKETIKTKIGDAMSFIKELPSKALQWGKDIVNGLWNGIKSLASTLKNNVSKFISDNVPGVVKKLLGINSPSKLFEGMGVNVVEGFSKGIEGTTKNLRNAASSMAQAATVGASSSMVRHTFDPLTVRGVNNQGELVAIVERTMKDILYWEGR